MLNFLYKNVAGRIALKALTAPGLSRTAGRFLDTKTSTFLIPSFIKSNDIDLFEVAEKKWESFNDFFTRRLQPGARPVCMDPEKLISPCDAFLKVYEIKEGSPVTVKDVPYSIEELVKSKKIAEDFNHGLCLVFRLTPSHYHRYIYPESGEKSREYVIPGVLHTVRPVATETRPVFAENARNFFIIKSKDFGPVVFMQVGAMLVGRIKNNDPEAGEATRGEEAGRFEFGGSTIVMLLKKEAAIINEEIIRGSKLGKEFPVKMGEIIGSKKV